MAERLSTSTPDVHAFGRVVFTNGRWKITRVEDAFATQLFTNRSIRHDSIARDAGLTLVETGDAYYRCAVHDAGMLETQAKARHVTLYGTTGGLAILGLGGAMMIPPTIEKIDVDQFLSVLETYKRELARARQVSAVLLLGALQMLAREDPQFEGFHVYWTMHDEPSQNVTEVRG